jgi:hypothetical protein
MKRVFTDPRFPGLAVHNSGDNVFTVYETSDGAMYEIDSFRTFAGQVDEATAARRANDYFDRLADGRVSDELLDRPTIQDERPAPSPNAAPPRGDPFGLSATKSLDQIMGDKVLTADDVLAAYDRAKSLPEGPERENALAQVKSMSMQLESSADELVRRLID